MDKILSNLMLANSFCVKKFLDEENYAENYRELALAHVSMFFRSESNWQIIEPLKEIGWRFRKKHILLKNMDTPNVKYILTWVLNNTIVHAFILYEYTFKRKRTKCFLRLNMDLTKV